MMAGCCCKYMCLIVGVQLWSPEALALSMHTIRFSECWLTKCNLTFRVCHLLLSSSRASCGERCSPGVVDARLWEVSSRESSFNASSKDVLPAHAGHALAHRAETCPFDDMPSDHQANPLMQNFLHWPISLAWQAHSPITFHIGGCSVHNMRAT